MQVHLWRIYVKPVLLSGLASLPVRPNVAKALTSFHHKTLRGFLKLSKYSPIPPLYFLLGELLIEGRLHLDTFSLFWNIWSNPQTIIFEIVKYILKMSEDSSVTWSVHIRLLCKMHSLPDLLSLLECPLWSKNKWKEHCKCRVTAYHEQV